MIGIDTNVLIAAHRREHARHGKALERLREIAEGQAPWGLPIFCIAEFLRVVTHPKVFTPPSSLEVAIEFVDRLMGSPSLRLLLPTGRFWATFAQPFRAGQLAGTSFSMPRSRLFAKSTGCSIW